MECTASECIYLLNGKCTIDPIHIEQFCFSFDFVRNQNNDIIAVPKHIINYYEEEVII